MIASVRHISKRHVQIRIGEGFGVTIFNVRGRDMEVVVAAHDGSETIRLKVDVPPDQTTSIEWATDEVGVVNILWSDIL